MSRRYAARIDKIQPAVVKAMRAIGSSVAVTSDAGKGFPDLVVGYQGRTILMELKDPDATKRSTGSRLTPAQAAFHASWRGDTLIVVSSVDQALGAVTGPQGTAEGKP